MKKTLAIALGVLLLVPTAHAGKKKKKEATPPPTIHLPCGWEEGTTFTYDVVHDKKSARTGVGSSYKSFSQTTFTIGPPHEVLTIAVGGTTGRFEGDEETVAFMTRLEGLLPTDFTMDLAFTGGQVIGLENQQVFVDVLEPFFREMMADKPPEAVDMALAALRQPTAWRSLAESALPVFTGHCAAMYPGQVGEVEEMAPTPFGVEVPVTWRFTATRHDEAARTLTITADLELDPDEFRASTIATVQSLLASMGKELPEEGLAELQAAPLPVVSSHVVTVYAIDDGFPLSVSSVKRTVLGEQVLLTETRDFTRVVPTP